MQGDFAASSQLVLSFNTCALRRKQWTGKIHGKYLIDNTLRGSWRRGRREASAQDSGESGAVLPGVGFGKALSKKLFRNWD